MFQRNRSYKTKRPTDFETAGALGIRVCPCTAIESASPHSNLLLLPRSRQSAVWVKRLQFARRTGHSTLTCASHMILHIESPIASICASHAIVRKLTMIQEDRACKVRDNVDIRRPRSVTCHAFHGAVQITARSSPTHGLERRLVRFLRLHRATLCCADFRV